MPISSDVTTQSHVQISRATSLAGRGRVGRRRGPSFWRRSAALDDGKAVLLLVAKKWHLGRHAAEVAGRAVGFPALGYVFDGEEPLPFGLGGLERGRDKRGRRRRACLGLMFDALGVSRLGLCIAPSPSPASFAREAALRRG